MKKGCRGRDPGRARFVVRFVDSPRFAQRTRVSYSVNRSSTSRRRIRRVRRMRGPEPRAHRSVAADPTLQRDDQRPHRRTDPAATRWSSDAGLQPRHVMAPSTNAPPGTETLATATRILGATVAAYPRVRSTTDTLGA